MVLVLGIMFVVGLQPMFIISMLMMIILFYSMFVYWGTSSFWLGYLLILVVMSGVLVIFTYMMSVLPNEEFEVFGMLSFLFLFITYSMYGEYFEVASGVVLSSIMIWSGVMMVSSMFLIIYLFFSMLMVVWISMLDKGAIRIN